MTRLTCSFCILIVAGQICKLSWAQSPAAVQSSGAFPVASFLDDERPIVYRYVAVQPRGDTQGWVMVTNDVGAACVREVRLHPESEAFEVLFSVLRTTRMQLLEGGRQYSWLADGNAPSELQPSISSLHQQSAGGETIIYVSGGGFVAVLQPDARLVRGRCGVSLFAILELLRPEVSRGVVGTGENP